MVDEWWEGLRQWQLGQGGRLCPREGGNVVYGGRVVGRVETVAARLGRTPVTREGIVRRALEKRRVSSN
jgi:hypothetical protein